MASGSCSYSRQPRSMERRCGVAHRGRVSSEELRTDRLPSHHSHLNTTSSSCENNTETGRVRRRREDGSVGEQEMMELTVKYLWIISSTVAPVITSRDRLVYCSFITVFALHLRSKSKFHVKMTLPAAEPRSALRVYLLHFLTSLT